MSPLLQDKQISHDCRILCLIEKADGYIELRERLEGNWVQLNYQNLLTAGVGCKIASIALLFNQSIPYPLPVSEFIVYKSHSELLLGNRVLYLDCFVAGIS